LRWIYYAVMLLFAIFEDKFYFIAMSFLGRLGIVSGRYLSLTYMDFTGSDLNLAFVYAIVGFSFFSFLLYRDNKESRDAKYMFITNLSMFAFIPLSIISANAGRILYYYLYIGLFTLPMVRNVNGKTYKFDSIRVKAGNKQLVFFTTFAFGLIYWLGTTGLNDYTGTINYAMSWFR